MTSAMTGPPCEREVELAAHSAGEPVTEHNDLFGSAVQLAARACARADVNGIFVSATVREHCGDAAVVLVERGPFELKGFGEPVPLFEVAWQVSG